MMLYCIIHSKPTHVHTSATLYLKEVLDPLCIVA